MPFITISRYDILVRGAPRRTAGTGSGGLRAGPQPLHTLVLFIHRVMAFPSFSRAHRASSVISIMGRLVILKIWGGDGGMQQGRGGILLFSSLLFAISLHVFLKSVHRHLGIRLIGVDLLLHHPGCGGEDVEAKADVGGDDEGRGHGVVPYGGQKGRDDVSFEEKDEEA